MKKGWTVDNFFTWGFCHVNYTEIFFEPILPLLVLGNFFFGQQIFLGSVFYLFSRKFAIWQQWLTFERGVAQVVGRSTFRSRNIKRPPKIKMQSGPLLIDLSKRVFL
jgi:hypothetical protein